MSIQKSDYLTDEERKTFDESIGLYSEKIENKLMQIITDKWNTRPIESELRHPQVVVCSAIRSTVTGRVIASSRHFSNITREILLSIGGYVLDEEGNPHGFSKEWEQAEDGFIDQYDNFLTRREAWIIAERNGQIKKMVGGNEKGVLYSENLY